MGQCIFSDDMIKKNKRGIIANSYKLNQSLMASIIKRFVLTDHINIEDSITQGRPLSGQVFAVLIDELNVELRAKRFAI